MNRTYRSRNAGGRKPAKRGGGGRIIMMVVVLLAAAGIVAGVMQMFKPGGGGSQTANANVTATPGAQDGGKFAAGVYVDDIPLGGLTMEEARLQIEAKQKEFAAEKAVMVAKGEETWPVRLEETVYAFDTEEVLANAWEQGRGAAEDVMLKTSLVSVDPSALEQKVRELAAPYTKEPVDAAFLGFDPKKPDGERLSFSPEVPGEKVDADALWAAVKAEFENRTFGTVEMQVVPIPPVATLAGLQADLQLLQLANIPAYEGASSSVKKSLNEANKGHTFTTRIRNYKTPRLTNIGLASASVSGLLLPGEVFDFNVRTGIRNYAAGYQDAPIDVAGTEDVGIGGGVCQVSSTLYNAVIRYGGKYETDSKQATKDKPGLAIVERDNHSVPSGYVMKGMDATVDMQLPSGKSNKNLRFRNDFDKPVLIVMYWEKIGSAYYEHCDIYGPPLTENGNPVTYNAIGKNNKKLPLNVDPLVPVTKVRYSEHAKPGVPELKSGGDGFTIDVYIEKTVNGKTESYRIYSDRCDPQPPYWYIYPGEAVPTATPTPSPTPSPTLAPTLAPTKTPPPTQTQSPTPTTDPA